LADCDRAMHIQTYHGVSLKVNIAIYIFRSLVNLISFSLHVLIECQFHLILVVLIEQSERGKKPKEQFHDDLSCDCSFNHE